MARVMLVHWKESEHPERLERIRRAGHEPIAMPLDAQKGLRALRKSPPDAVVIDLGRLPSHGRDLGLVIRERKATRQVPIVFVEGAPEKVERVRRALPDASYARWRGIRGALKKALATPPRAPRVPSSRLEGYSGTPLPKKLGITPGAVVTLVGAPDGFEKTLGPLPPDLTIRRRMQGRTDLTLWFPTSRRDLERRMEQVAVFIADGDLWIVWPKQASGVATDLTQNDVRREGLAAGLVDYKICAVDATYSGLKFTRRKARSRA